MSNGKYYIGSTGNLDKRIEYHNLGKVKTTSKFLPIQLLYSREYNTFGEARKIEIYLKKCKSRKSTGSFMNGKI